jgi:hypothetical protein
MTDDRVALQILLEKIADANCEMIGVDAHADGAGDREPHRRSPRQTFVGAPMAAAIAAGRPAPER